MNCATDNKRSRRRTWQLGAFLAVGVLCSSLTLAGPNSCDTYAAHPNDPDKVLPGLFFERMDLKKAEQACRRELSNDPRHARTNFHLGRVLYYDGRGREALQYLERAAETGYRQAIFVLGYIKTTGEQKFEVDYCAAANLWLRSAALDHPWSGSYLVKHYIRGDFDDCNIKFDDAALKRLMALTTDNVVFTHSEGEIESVLAELKEYLSK